MPCVFQGAKAGTVGCCGGRMTAHGCSCNEQGLQYCLPDATSNRTEDVSLLDNRVQRYELKACGDCEYKTIATRPNERSHREITNADSPTIRRWKKTHWEGRPLEKGKHAVVINIDPKGFGDAIVAAWIAEGTKGRDPAVFLYAKHKREFLEVLLGQRVSTDQRLLTPVKGFSIEQSVRGVANRIDIWCRQFGVESAYSRPKHRLPPGVTQWAKNEISRVRGESGASIALCPQTAHTARLWPERYWHELYAQLVEKGHKPFFLGTPDHEYQDYPNYFGQGWVKHAALILESDLVIGNDSAPAHLAGTYNVPTIAILGATGEAAFSHMPSVRCIATERRLVDCVGCWYAGNYNRGICSYNCAALSNVRPSQVMRRAMEVLEEESA